MSPAFFFVDDFLKNHLDYALAKRGKQVLTFFETFTAILKSTEIHKSLELIIPVRDLVQRLCLLILASEGARDEHLIGLFKLMKTLLDQFPGERADFADKALLLRFLVHDCLFLTVTQAHVGHRNETSLPPKCKDPDSRSWAQNLVQALCIDNP